MNTASMHYVYNATVVRVIDGDTVVLDVDLGFKVRMKMSTRLWGINAPELNTEEGRNVRDWLKAKLPEGTTVTFDSRKDKADKYGRYLAVLWLEGDDCPINDQLVASGMAVEYMR